VELVEVLVEVVQSLAPQLLATTRLMPIDVECLPNGQVNKLDFREDEVALAGQTVLLLDGAVHSGRVMSACADHVLKHGASELTSYTLVLKRSSTFIPTIWGLMTDETDRAYFLLNKIPNNRLHAGRTNSVQAPVHIRRLDKGHLSQPPLVCGVPSIDRMTWGDRLFQMQTSHGSSCTYMLERGSTIVGFLSVHEEPNKLNIAEIVVDPALQDTGYGGVLMRFADTLARQTDCALVCLNAIEARVPWYQQRGYEVSAGKQILELENERYQPMERRVLYHQQPR
jgi:N-acetylglutamate synthase-like GNAT family acetyltransferase